MRIMNTRCRIFSSILFARYPLPEIVSVFVQPGIVTLPDCRVELLALVFLLLYSMGFYRHPISVAYVEVFSGQYVEYLSIVEIIMFCR